MSRRSAKAAALNRDLSASPKPPPTWLRPVVLGLAALLLFGWFVSPVANPDTWWHLESGRYIWQTHHLPSPDPFAYTTASARPAYPAEPEVRDFNLTHEWLAQLLFYFAWAAGGAPALVMLRAAMLTAFCGLAGLVAWRRTGGACRSVAVALAAALIAGNFAADRPFLFTYLFLAITIYIVDNATPRKLWLLPPLFLIWANCHGGYFLGWVPLAAFSVAAVLRRDTAHRRTLWIVSAASVLASGLNPNGFRALTVTLAYRSSVLQSSLWEWQRPRLWPPDFFAALLFATAAVLLWRRRHVRPADWLLYLAFAAASVTAMRNTILIGWLGPVLIASYVAFTMPLPRWSGLASAVLLAAALVAGVATGNLYQFRSVEWLYPRGAGDFLLAHRLPGPIFNTYEHGGYLMWRLWPRQKVFIDGRALSDSLFHDYQRILYALPADREPAGLALLDSYGVQTIVVNGFEYGSGAIYLLPVALSDPRQSEWKLVYRDEDSMIFVRRPPPGVAPLPLSEVYDALEAECSSHIAHLPGEPLCATYLGMLYQRQGQVDRARRWIQALRQGR